VAAVADELLLPVTRTVVDQQYVEVDPVGAARPSITAGNSRTWLNTDSQTRVLMVD
jgi:hypothetical protein